MNRKKSANFLEAMVLVWLIIKQSFFSEDDNYEVFSLNKKKITDFVLTLKPLKKTINDFNPDVIINCAAKSWRYFLLINNLRN